MRPSHILVIHALIMATAATGVVMRADTVLADGSTQPTTSQKLKLKTGEEITLTQDNGRFAVKLKNAPAKDGKLTLSDGTLIRVRDGVLIKASIDKLGLVQQVKLKTPLDGHPNAIAVITKDGVRFQQAGGAPIPDGSHKFGGPAGKTFTIKNGVMPPDQPLLITIGSAQFEATKDQVLGAASLSQAGLAKLTPPLANQKVDLAQFIDPAIVEEPCNHKKFDGFGSCYQCGDGLCSFSCYSCGGPW
jgi:hypothetical protein